MSWFPDPVAFSIGSLAIRWYGLAYVFGMLFSWFYGRRCIQKGYFPGVSVDCWDGLMNCLMLGIVIGGRLGYFILYSPETFWTDPLEILKIWHPGMAFHGGLLGAVLAIMMYARGKVSTLSLFDVVAVSAPIGLFLGRIANFINQEHCGKPTDVSWGLIFPTMPDSPRHPSQLYEAGLEGVVLLLILMGVMRSFRSLQPGQLGGLFLFLYGMMRLFTESFRIPEGQWCGITLAQYYSIPMIGIGVGLVFWHRKRNRHFV
ncbi:MAG: prolipoprotein diacylglyceryl transferase [Alphaproteobacteria bacterium]|nr:prolipoprotein diacylglyceryl transferase [Alphaproteobacteria bacterium]